MIESKDFLVNAVAKQYVLSAVITQGEIAFVSHCPELGVTSQGKTESVALENLREAVTLYLEDEDVQKQLKKHPLKPAHFTSLVVTA